MKEKIKNMLSKYLQKGEITLKKLLESNDQSVSYSAIVLHESSHKRLVERFLLVIPEGWKIYANHMTINLGELKNKEALGEEIVLKGVKLGLSDMAMAIEVEGYPSKNEIPHITIAINKEKNAKPFMSNQITEWVNIKPIFLLGVITEIKK